MTTVHQEASLPDLLIAKEILKSQSIGTNWVWFQVVGFERQNVRTTNYYDWY